MKWEEAGASSLATAFIRECAREQALIAVAQIRLEDAAETTRLLTAFEGLQQRLARPMGRFRRRA